LAKANKIAGDKGSMGDDIANISPQEWLGNGREKIMERKFHQTAAENVSQIAHLIRRFQATQPHSIPPKLGVSKLGAKRQMPANYYDKYQTSGRLRARLILCQRL